MLKLLIERLVNDIMFKRNKKSTRIKRAGRKIRRINDRTMVSKDYMKKLSEATLEEMIAAARIVVAKEVGIDANVKKASRVSNNIAKHVIEGKTRRGKINGISMEQLNAAIVKKNEIENKPSEKVQAIYKKMMDGEGV